MSSGYSISNVKEFASERMEIVLMLILLFIGASFAFPVLRSAAYIALAGGVAVMALNMLLRSNIITEIPEYKRAVVFRMGHYHRVAGPGWVFISPMLEKAEVVDLRVQELDLPPQDVITVDEIRTTIDAIVYYQILDPKKAVLKVKEFEQTIAGYVFAALRDVSSDLTLNELYGELEKVNDIVKVKIEPLVSEWGINIVDVEIKDITIPESIQTAMHHRRRAKEEWAAAQYEARTQKTMIEALADAGSKLDDKALTYLYIKEGIPRIAEGKSTKIFFPTEFSNLARSFGSSGAKFEANDAMKALYPLALKKAGEALEEEEPDDGDAGEPPADEAKGKKQG